MMDASAQSPIPACIELHRDGRVSWWAPIRSGDDAEDYAAGAAAFRDAQAMAAHGIAFGLMCSFIINMREVQAYEMGFLDALAAACIACSAPCLYTEQHIAEQVAASDWTVSPEVFRQGNLEAWRDRRTGRADRIVRELIRVVLLRGNPSSPAYVHSISMAVCRSDLMTN
jgi:hypothetical protein